MKMTLVLPDKLMREVKSRAALQGQPLSRYVRECLERSLRDEATSPRSFRDRVAELPSVPKQACKDLAKAVADPSFRPIDEEMWR